MKLTYFNEAMSKKTTNIQDLYVADFREDSHTDASRKWKERKLSTKVFRAEACARQIWVGSKDEFSDFPELNEDPRNEMLEGAQGYKRLLSYVLGIVNPGQFDPAAEKRFFDGWSAINRTCPKYAEPYNLIVAKVVADSQMIKKNYLNNTVPERPWLIARELAQHSDGDHALIIGSIDETTGRLSPMTEKIALSINGNGFDVAGRVFVTHPDEEIKRQILEKLEDLYDQKNINIVPEEVDFDFSTQGAGFLDDVDQVYVMMECDQYPESYAQLMRAWRDRTRDDNIMVDTKNGLDQAKHHISLSRSDLKKEDVYWADTLFEERKTREVYNAYLVDEARAAIDKCAEMRELGKTPVIEHAHEYSL